MGILNLLFSGAKATGYVISELSDKELLKLLASSAKKGIDIASRSKLIQEALRRGLKIPKL